MDTPTTRPDVIAVSCLDVIVTDHTSADFEESLDHYWAIELVGADDQITFQSTYASILVNACLILTRSIRQLRLPHLWSQSRALRLYALPRREQRLGGQQRACH